MRGAVGAFEVAAGGKGGKKSRGAEGETSGKNTKGVHVKSCL